MINQLVTINAKEGFHARPASVFVKIASGFQSDVYISYGDKRVNGKSIMSILTLGATGGTQVAVEVIGSDEAEAFEALSRFVLEME